MTQSICAPLSRGVSVPTQTLTAQTVRTVASIMRKVMSANVAWLD